MSNEQSGLHDTDARLAPFAEEEREMPIYRCQECDRWNDTPAHERSRQFTGAPGALAHEPRNPRVYVDIARWSSEGARYGRDSLAATGIVTCLLDGKRIPFSLAKGDYTEPPKLLEHSRALSPRISTDFPALKQDIEEAEACHFGQIYKASAAMCRRAMQRGLIQCGIKDQNLSSMLNEAKQKQYLVDGSSTFSLAWSVKDVGDQGVHRPEPVDEHESATMIWAAVQVLNAIEPHMPPPASQSGTGSNAP